ncbi:MAG: hypothetical protein ACOH1R_04790 [Luteimonas sp.]
MSTIDTEHDAVTRLFDLACSGDTDNCEFSQLDSMVYESLSQTYAVNEDATMRTQTAV